MIKAIIFDCFGVILGSAYQTRLQELEQESPEKAEEARAINHASDMGIISREESSRLISELFAMDLDEFIAEQAATEVPNEALLDYIGELKKEYKIGMLSNVASRERIGIRFEDGRLDTLFNTIVTSGEEGYIKPASELYTIAATRLGVEPHECVFIDDIAAFCEGAKAVGMEAIEFSTTAKCIADLEPLLDRGATRY